MKWVLVVMVFNAQPVVTNLSFSTIEECLAAEDAMRAVAQDSEIALVQGIRVEVIFPLAFVLGVGLAALAGALMAPVLSVSPFVGLAPTLKAFVVVVIGGLGSVPGAVAGGLLIGLIESFAGGMSFATLGCSISTDSLTLDTCRVGDTSSRGSFRDLDISYSLNMLIRYAFTI